MYPTKVRDDIYEYMGWEIEFVRNGALIALINKWEHTMVNWTAVEAMKYIREQEEKRIHEWSTFPAEAYLQRAIEASDARFERSVKMFNEQRISKPERRKYGANTITPIGQIYVSYRYINKSNPEKGLMKVWKLNGKPISRKNLINAINEKVKVK